jgi:hypothetical protein
MSHKINHRYVLIQIIAKAIGVYHLFASLVINFNDSMVKKLIDKIIHQFKAYVSPFYMEAQYWNHNRKSNSISILISHCTPSLHRITTVSSSIINLFSFILSATWTTIQCHILKGRNPWWLRFPKKDEALNNTNYFPWLWY